MTTRSTAISWCRSQLGYQETPQNLTKYAALAGHANGYPWCATFLVAMAKQTGLKLPSYSAYTPTMANAFKSIGQYGRTPRVGAFMFVYYPSIGRIGHVGIVEAVNADGTITTLEGNSNASGSRTGGAVCRVRRNLSNLTFGYPTYTAPPAPPTTHANPWAAPKLTRSRPYVSRTSAHTVTDVKYIQWAAGGPNYDDGVWGDITEGLVRKFQKDHGLGVDGRVGPLTLQKMAAVRR